MKKKILFFILLVIFFCPGLSVSAEETANYKINVKELGDDRIQMDLNVTNFGEVYGSQIYLNFNTSALEAVEILSGDVIIEGDSSVRLILKKIQSGKIAYMITKVGSETGEKNQGILFSVIFDKKGSGNYGFALSGNSLLSDKDGNIVALKPFEEAEDPNIVAVYPAANAMNVATDEPIRITFDKAIKSDMDMFREKVILKEGDTVISDLIFTLENDGKELVVSRAEDGDNVWSKGAFYEVTIKEGILDEDNKEVKESRSWSFITKGEDVVLQMLTPMDKLKVNDTFKMTIKAANTISMQKEVTLILALFDDYNNMIEYKTERRVLKAGEVVTLEDEIELSKEGTLKCMVWDTLEDMDPMTDAVKFQVVQE